MNERDAELFETLNALIQDLSAGGWHIVLAVATPDAKHVEMCLTSNDVVVYSLAELLRARAYDDLMAGVESDDES